jgi:sugar phosphate isomerase/epimerase
VRRLPGEAGVIDAAAFLAPLAARGYAGPVTAQPNDAALNALPADESAARTVRALRGTVAKISIPVS